MFVLHVLMSRHQRAASATQVSPRKKPLSSLDVDWDAISWKSERDGVEKFVILNHRWHAIYHRMVEHLWDSKPSIKLGIFFFEN